MGRLIDADALQKYLREEYHGMISDESMKIYEILRLIDAQKTAYDTEKVIELLKKATQYVDLSNPSSPIRSEVKCIHPRVAIEIVRKGGVE